MAPRLGAPNSVPRKLRPFLAPAVASLGGLALVGATMELLDDWGPKWLFAILLAAAYGGSQSFATWRLASKRFQAKLSRIQTELADRLKRIDTGSMFSARNFHSRLDQECHRSRRYGLAMSVIFVGCLPEQRESMKEHWPEVSARVLALSAQSLRHEDVVGNLGNLEYGFCLPHTDGAGAEVVVGRLTKLLAKYDPHIGIGSLGEGVASAESVLNAAKTDAEKRFESTKAAIDWNEQDIA